MKAHFRRNRFNSITVAGIILFIASAIFTDQPYLLMLSAAQLIFVPVTLPLLLEPKKIHIIFSWAAMLSVFLLHFVGSNVGQIALAMIYLLFTLFVAFQGARRFLRRGFTNWAEISIDVGMMYLFVGGLWFFAYVAGIDTGFGPLLTWLTAIHFHYSAYLLPISVGFFGRLHDSTTYRWIASIVLAGPMLVAIGISFWPLLEFVSALLYVAAIYALIALSFRTRFVSPWQAALIRVSYGALGVTILFSLLYAAHRAFGGWPVSIELMLAFHGGLNSIVFGAVGVLGWALAPPETKREAWTFPVSQIRGALQGMGERKSGLVDDLSVFVDTKSLPPSIAHFYEQTEQYRLFASVQWAAWFKPFAVCYKAISARMRQINLPLSSKRVEMIGAIRAVDPLQDGRDHPRVWIRKAKQRTVFVAIYSQHETKGRTYMNIALPLPFSTMIGILRLDATDGALTLTSEGEGDAGIYLAVGKALFKLPLSERFIIEETGPGSLAALHMMRIFGIPFLRIDYDMFQK